MFEVPDPGPQAHDAVQFIGIAWRNAPIPMQMVQYRLVLAHSFPFLRPARGRGGGWPVFDQLVASPRAGSRMACLAQKVV